MRVGLNLLHAMPSIGGGWNYITNLIQALGECGSGNEFVAFVTDTSAILVPQQENFVSIKINLSPKSRFSRISYENTLLNRLAKKYELDCLHWFANIEAPFSAIPGAVTIYDLLVYHSPDAFPLIKRWYLRLGFNLTVRKKNVLLPMSETTNNELKKYLPNGSSTTIVIPPIIQDTFKPQEKLAVEAFKKKYYLPDNFWLYVAHTYKHKNHIRLLKAYSKLQNNSVISWPLVLRGDPKDAEDVVVKEIERLQIQDFVIRLPRLEYEELPLLYSAASTLVFPSLFEGGGIPILEAMACGCPVITSNINIMREFTGDATIRFDELSVDSICETMIKVQTNPDLRKYLSQDGLKKVEEFSMSHVVKKLLYGYETAIKLHKDTQ